MARVTMKALLPVSAQRLWPLVRWDGRLLDWYPGAVALDVDGTAKGDLRRLRLREGAVLVHRLDHLSRIEDAYTYSVLDGPYPVAGYLAQIRVLPHEDGRATLIWTANFLPAGIAEDAAEDFIRRLYQAGFDSLYSLLADGAGAEKTSTARAGLRHGPNTPQMGS
ncbi:SRPBCC family protein [Azospirillum sp. sgz301742]